MWILKVMKIVQTIERKVNNLNYFQDLNQNKNKYQKIFSKITKVILKQIK